MKHYIFSTILLFIFINLSAQQKSDANLLGHVTDKITKEHIPFVNITLKGTYIATSTDATGHFYLKNLPEGRAVIVVSGIGYKKSEREVVIEKGKNTEINFELEEDQIQMETVVVSATRSATGRKEAPAVVNVLTGKMFETTNSVCLAQGLSFQPGLRVETNCQNCGFQQVRINGLDGSYSQILIDSRPVFSSLAGVYGIEQIPANMIERVEIVRGGGSATFGSNAVAGTINIITKEPVVNSLTISNNSGFYKGGSHDINTTINGSVISEDYKTGIMLFGSIRQRSAMDYDGDGFTEIGKLNLRNIGFRGYRKFGANSRLTFEYHSLYEYRRGGNKLDLVPHETDITEQTEHDVNAGGIKYEIFSDGFVRHFNLYASGQLIDRKSYYGTGKNPNAYGLSHDKTGVAGAQYSQEFKRLIFMPARFTAGVEYSINSLSDKMLGYNRQIDQTTFTQSFFVQNEWKNNQLSILLGGRADKHNMIEKTIFSPRISARYTPIESIVVRGGYSEGFRPPQAFEEDLHVTAVGGAVSLISIAPGLKPEKSRSYNLSADFYPNIGKIKSNILIEGFYTDLSNVFYLDEIGKDGAGNLLMERRNGEGAIVKGVNIEGRIVPFDILQLQFGFTHQSSMYKTPLKWSKEPSVLPQKRMFRSPDNYGYLTANISVTKNTNVAISGIYTGSMLVQHFAGFVDTDREFLTPSFFDFGVKASKTFAFNSQTSITIHLALQNIFNSYQKDFDQGENRDSGYIYGPSFPRSLNFGLKISI